MKKLFANPIIALILCVILILASGAISSRLHINKIVSSQGIDAAVAEYEEYTNQFPGNIFLKLSGFSFGG